ncbi:MAG: GMC family oxidoreductase [Alphaproteobacteria bacterium]|nr:GMC family oxidoreductase [Alphaproteobacteria bacterium]
MARMMPKKDAVIIGLGWTGAILAEQLTAAGLNVVAIERGPWRDTATDFNIGYMQDELRYAVRKDLFLHAATEAMTMRNNPGQTALPMRDYGSFLPGHGVGGAGVHWNGKTWRFQDTDFEIHSHLRHRYGARKLRGLQLQDWGVTWKEIEHCFDAFEYVAGISGKAGNINGVIQEGGNPFESPRSREFPNPPLKTGYPPMLFEQVTREMGYHPFPEPSANCSRPYVNPLGVAMGECTYCGFCERFGCANYSKASAQTTILPVLMARPNFEARTECEVLKVNLSEDGKMARSVTYIDAKGTECEQPGDMVLICAYGLMNVRMMLLSGIGTQYDPLTGKGTVGRNYCYQTSCGARIMLEGKRLNPFIASGAMGRTIHDFQGDVFDHSHLDFVGGAGISCDSTNGRPILYRPLPEGAPRWGAGWKQAAVEGYQNSMGIGSQGSSYPVKENYLDLDPTYTDRHGRPLLRITFEFPDNDIAMSNYMADQLETIAKAFNPKSYAVSRTRKDWNSVPYQSTHNTGGAIMGENPRTSAVNKYLQSWDVPNVFVIGASAFAHNAGMNPTGTVGALAYWAAEAITTKYIKRPGALVHA